MPSKVLRSVTTTMEVPFFDVDAMHIVWHGHYVKYLEVARCALLDTFEYNYLQMRDSGFMWPIVDMRIKYVSPAKFFRHIDIRADLVEIENRMKIEYRITDSKSGEVLTKAHTVQVAVCIETEEMLFESPQVVFDKLGICKGEAQ